MDFFEKTSSALKVGDHKTAQEAFKAGLLADQKAFIDKVKKKGILRPSRYDFKSVAIWNLAENALQEISNLDLFVQEYLKSIQAISCAAKKFTKLLKKLRAEFKRTNIRNYIATLELMFCAEQNSSRKVLFPGAEEFSQEELAEGFSYLYFEYINGNHFDFSELKSLDEKGIEAGLYAQDIASFCKLVKFKECEIRIDYFDYNASYQKNLLRIFPGNTKLAKAIEYGFLAQLLQWYGNYDEFRRYSESISFVEACKMLQKLNFFEIKTHPAERIVTRIPLSEEFKRIISFNGFLKEEEVEILTHLKELLISEETFFQQPIFKNITCLDILKFQRFFRYLFFMLRLFIKENHIDSLVLIRSFASCVEAKEFEKSISYFFGNKADQLLQLFVWSLSSNQIFDVQYQPLMKLNDLVVMPLSVISISNLIRNCMKRNLIRFDSDSGFSPVEDEIGKSLLLQTQKVKKNISYSFNEQKGDVDVIAVFQNTILIFECKNSLFPCSVHELRTSFDYIKKAANQLSCFEQLMKDNCFREYFSKKIKIELRPDMSVITCILMGNRMLSGGVVEGHAIRSIHEVCSFIKTGDVVVKELLSDDVGKINLWGSEDFHENDLEAYFNEGLLHEPIYASLTEYPRIFSLDGCNVFLDSFALDQSKMLNSLKEIRGYKKIKDPQKPKNF